MNEALQLIYYVLDKFLEFIFGAYIFSNISLGMIMLVSFIFVIMLRYLMAVPKIKVGFRNSRGADNEK